MRLICRSSNGPETERFFRFLAGEGIEAQYEVLSDSDGQEETHQIWIVQEDELERATDWYEQFSEDPNDPRFSTSAQDLILEAIPPKETKKQPPRRRIQTRSPGMGPLTIIVLFICIGLYLMGLFTGLAETERTPEGYQPPPVNSVYAALLFDYPAQQEAFHELLRKYPIDQINQPQQLPPEGKRLYVEWQQTPAWRGLYPAFVALLRGEEPGKDFYAPWMEKIQGGEWWRLVTPCFLHATEWPLHIFFNMLWLIMLGSQMERRLRASQYIAFILLTGLLSNLAQYAVGGPQFLGYSGVILAMLGFMWTRSKHAPWEGYVLPPGTVMFVAAFVLLFAGFQVLLFLQEVSSGQSSGGMMANTAHLAGAFVGWAFGHSRLFRASA